MVYILFWYNTVEGVFATEEAAEAEMARLKAQPNAQVGYGVVAYAVKE